MTLSKLRVLLKKVYDSEQPAKEDLVVLLSLEKEEETKELFAYADQVRKEFAGDGILLRGIVEFSNYCRNSCYYCGLNKNNKTLLRYRMTDPEVLDSVGKIVAARIKTVVLQSGRKIPLIPSGWQG